MMIRDEHVDAARPRGGDARNATDAVVDGHDEPRRESGIILQLAGDMRLRLPESISGERLAELVQALEAQAGR